MNEETASLKQKAITITVATVICLALIVLPLSPVSLGQGPLGFGIIQITEQGGFTAITSGNVDDPITVAAVMNTANGSYRVWFNETLVDTGTSVGYFINSNFSVPALPTGNYNITLMDVTLNINTTAEFALETAYGIKALVPQAPAQLQEGSTVVLNVTVTGGLPNTEYAANVTVALPSALSTAFIQIITFTSNAQGTAQRQLNFPSADFPGSGSMLQYTGSYSAFFNQTESLAQDTFFVGFTDLSAYHRGETVRIHAVGYQPSQAVAFAILFDQSPRHSAQATASSQGVIDATWTVPSDAPIGQYTATLTPAATAKAITDRQTFEVPGYPVDFRALNLAGETVPEIQVEALDQATSRTYSGTTGALGVSRINLEKGNHTVTAYWNQVNVGEIRVSISGNNTYDIACQLTNLKIVVQNKNGVRIPFADLNLTYSYVTTKTGVRETRSVTGQTDLSGTYAFNSTLSGISYVVDASKYGVAFNAGNNTVSNLPAQPTYEVTLMVPDETLTVSTIDYKQAALPNARIELVEQASGIFYSVTTNDAGAASVEVTFGQYRLRVFTADNILLNETVINVLNDTNRQIRCILYNLDVSVKVVDYFGNSISNAQVQLSRPGMATRVGITGGDGIAAFPNVIGGDIEVTAYPAGNENSYVARNLQIDSPTAVQLQMANFVSLGGMLVGTAALATVIVVLVAALVFIVAEVYRRTGFRLRRKSVSADAE